jgi:DsbC/DsbD-like thiol-disulfide interchange protein
MRILLLSAFMLVLAGTTAAQSRSGGAIELPKVETQHLVLTASSSTAAAAPGTRISLFLDIAPKPKMHVYTPEQKEQIPISLSLAIEDEFKAHPIKFPKSEKYFFEPLGETQLVYSKPFRLVQDVTVALTPAMAARAREAGATLTITGTLRYQACDDKVCYLPKELPVSWTIRLAPPER